MNLPLISIIIPIHNDEKYLSRCLDSIVNQTLQNIEVICINDASTDSTALILDDYERNYTIIKRIDYKTNQSAYVARNHGISLAKGAYIMFVDGDDSLSFDACEKLYALIKKKKVDILHFSTMVHNAGSEKRRIERLNRHIAPFLGKIENNGIIDLCFIEKKYQWNLWDKIYTSDICKNAVKLLRNTYLPKGNDIVLYFAIAYVSNTYRGVRTKSFYNYYYGAGSSGKNQIDLEDLAKFIQQKKVVDELYRIIHDNNMNIEYEKICIAFNERFFIESLDNLVRYLPKDKWIAGLEILQEKWSKSELYNYIISTNDSEYNELQEYFNELHIYNNSEINECDVQKKNKHKTICRKKGLWFSLYSRVRIIIHFHKKYGLSVVFGMLRTRLHR